MFQYIKIEGDAEAFAVVPKSYQEHKGVFYLKLQRIIAVIYYVLAES